MRSVRVVAGVAGHLLLVIVAVVAVLVATSHAAYPPLLRVALLVLVAVLAAVTLVGRFPLGLGPVAGSVTARTVRMVGTALAGPGATGVVLGFAQGGSPSGRASADVPIAVANFGDAAPRRRVKDPLGVQGETLGDLVGDVLRGSEGQAGEGELFAVH